ncbi:MAG TPA: flagellar hook-length control protein FliK [Epulopiscium sp.]|nr:flagellar hook-length control protein FliK [Candidatus Epulonipiscium sp.]
MNIQLSTMEFSIGRAQINQNVSKRELFNENQESFGSVLKNTQNSKQNHDPVQSEVSISRNEKNIKTSLHEKHNDKVENSQAQYTNKDKEVPTEDEVIDALAEKTGMTEEEIESVLNELGITVFDLLLPQNLQQFLQHIHNVEDSMELLSIPNINQTYKDIMSLFQDLKESFPILQNIVGSNEILKSTTINNEEMMQIDLFMEKQTQEESAQNIPTTSNNVLLEKQSQFDTNFSQNNSDTQSQTVTDEITVIDIKKDEAISTNSSSTLSNDELEESDEIGAVNLNNEFVENIELNGNNIIVQQNIISDGRIIESTQAQINPHSVNTEQLINQMVEHIKVNITEDTTEMNLQLKPDHLGNLSLKIITERGIITAQFVAESQTVKEIIEANFNQLKDVLQEQGFLIQNLEVSVKQEFQDQGSNFMERNTSKSAKRIREILSDLSEDSVENYNAEYNNPYRRSDSEIDFSA